MGRRGVFEGGRENSRYFVKNLAQIAQKFLPLPAKPRSLDLTYCRELFFFTMKSSVFNLPHWWSTTEIDHRVNIRFHVKLNKSATETSNLFSEVYGEDGSYLKLSKMT
jgi:hypothetical protein